MSNHKSKLTLDEQVQYMKDNKGIKFDLISEEDAKHYLYEHNYYFKIKSYAKNYEKYTKGENIGKYINLDFAYLIEMSKIDMYFRRFILKMTLDIEHFLKLQLLRDFVVNNNEDGYKIVEALFSKYDYINNNIENRGRNSASTDLISKYSGKFALWNVVEVLSFGDFIKLYELYYEKYPTQGSLVNYLWSVKFLRNASAHNTCLLNTLKIPYSTKVQINKQLSTYLSNQIGLKSKSKNKKLSNPIIHDFIATLYVYNNVVTSKNIKAHTMSELKEFMDIKLLNKKVYFKNNQVITSYYIFIKQCVDFFYDLSI